MKLKKTVLAAMLAGATVVTMTSAQAWWGGPGGYDRGGWGNNGMSDWMGDG